MTPNTSTTSHRWPLVVALLPFALLVLYHWTWGVPAIYGDHGQYLSHARALIEGRPYSDIGYIYNPAAPMVGPRAYPPGFPLTLVPFVAIGGPDSMLVRVLMIATLVAFGYFAYRRLATVIAPGAAALAVAFALVAIEVRLGGVVPLSDAGLSAILWALVLLVDSASAWTWKRIALVTALGFAAMSYRVVGVVVVPALSLYALVSWREHRGRALIPVAIWGVAGAALLVASAAALPFAEYLIPQVSEIPARLLHVWRVYRIAIFEVELYPSPLDRLNDAYHLAATVVAAAGTAALLWRYRRSMLVALTGTYTLLLIAAPVMEPRYLWPLFPVIVAGLITGLSAACRAVARLVNRPAAGQAVAVILLGLVLAGGVWQGLTARSARSLDRDADAQQLFTWLRERQAREPLRVAFYNPRVLTVKTRVPAMGAILAPPVGQLRAMRERAITHMIWQNIETAACTIRALNAVPRAFPDRVRLEYENATFRVYRLTNLEELPADTLAFGRLPTSVCETLPPA